MPLHVNGAAYVDPTGTVLAADAGFVARLGIDGDPSEAVRAMARSSPEIRALLAGDGPPLVCVAGADGATLELERVPGSAGALLVVREASAGEWGEHALRSQGLGRLVAGITHDIRNPLNAMSLQLALLSEKLSGGGDASAASASHLAALRGQIARVNEVLRRVQEVMEPSAPLGYTDLGALARDVAALLGHDARRRGIEVSVAATEGAVRTRSDPARVARIVLALCSTALARTPSGGRFAVSAEARGTEAALVVEHTAGDPGHGIGYDTEVLAAGATALGGRLDRERDERGSERRTLLVPRNDRE